MSPLTFDIVVTRINAQINASAEKAQREIKAMAESARRSIGQMTRLDHFWRRAR